jgi:hypothetical protein
MSHVDALSRIVSLISTLPLERELEFHQLNDPIIKKIAEDLEQSDHDKFELINLGLVFRKSDKSQFYVPESMVENVIRIYHDDMSHCSEEKTLQGISVNYWFPSLRRSVRLHIENCITCLLANSASNSRRGKLQMTKSPSIPFEIIHMDHFDLINQTDQGYKHIFLVVNAFTRFTWLFPVKLTSSKELIKHLIMLFQIFGNPQLVVPDRGTAFTSLEFESFLKEKMLNIG